MTKEQLAYLFQQYFSGNCSEEEKLAFFTLLQQEDSDEVIGDLIAQRWDSHEFDLSMPEPLHQKILLRLDEIAASSRDPLRSIKFYNRSWVRYAAAILILAGIGSLFFPLQPRQVKLAVKQKIPVLREVSPGRDKAVLTLDDGTTILLDSLVNGATISQGRSQIVKLANGKLEYHAGSSTGNPITYNTLKTPRGGQYQLALPDGSLVWLNAASSIRYPTAFTTNQRIVQVTGEVYLEVAKDKSKPFIVEAGDTRLEVLGTHFNVNAYAEEPSLNATLLEGAIRVLSGNQVMQLTPGQQCQLSLKGEMKLVKNADVDQAVAWKNGGFSFYHTRLDVVMRQLSRWYDIQIVYPEGIPDIEFGGDIQRSLPLSEMLAALSDMQVKFRIAEGRKLIVLP